jgi:hypothetical protein
MPLFIAVQQVCVVGDGAVDAGMDAMRVGGSNPECHATIGEVRSHGCVVGDMFE